MKGSTIGELEELVLLTVANLSTEAYGISIRDFIKEKCGRSISLSTVHATIHRLETKGYLTSQYDNSNMSSRGGRPKLVFSLTSTGKQIIKAVYEMRNELWHGIQGFSLEFKLA